VRYVITLDTDTQLPRDRGEDADREHRPPRSTARTTITQRQRIDAATAFFKRASPLSLPRHAALAVLRGCTPATPASIRIRAPFRTSTRTPSARLVRLARASTTSDAFRVRAERSPGPENRILSHDLLEGCYVRFSGRVLSRRRIVRKAIRRVTSRTCSVRPPAGSVATGRSAHCGCCRACREPTARLREEPAFPRMSRLESAGQPAPQLVPVALTLLIADGLDRVAGAMAVDSGRARGDVRFQRLAPVRAT
jgi:hypothetical protein